MTAIYNTPFERLEVFLNEYQPQLEKAINAIKILKNTAPNSEEFSQALADLHVCSKVGKVFFFTGSLDKSLICPPYPYNRSLEVRIKLNRIHR